jgi:chemotaxis signal transduction protein
MVILSLARTLYAVPTTSVREMLSTPEVRSVPQAPAAVRGLILLRDTTLPLVDLRTVFGLPTMESEAQAFVSMLEQREEDHRRCLNELESSVRENRPFTLTTDPHACAFGRWYDTFKTSNLLLEAVLKRFDAPHKRIHALGETVVDLVHHGRQAEAMAIIAAAREGVLTQMIDLFHAAEDIVREEQREIAVVIAHEGRSCALAVDAIESVERLSTEAMTRMDDTIGAGSPDSIVGVGRRVKDKAFVFVLDPGAVLRAA